jgi:hypothetical protein
MRVRSEKILRLILTTALVTSLLLSDKAISQELNRLTPSERVRDSQAARNGESAVAEPRASSISGRIMTESGQPLANALVYLRRTGPNKSALIFTTDEDGRFSTENLQAGAYVITASASGYVMPNQTSGLLEPAVYQPGDSVNITMVKGGIITGKVLDARGEPMAGLNVRPIRVRDLDGKLARALAMSRERQTDDRGIYRLYGLEPGIYIIAAGGSGQPRLGANPYEYDTPTYYPSGARDSAAEVRVAPGMETGGIDVRYRGERGYSIGGTVTGLPAGSTLWVALNYSGSNLPLTAVTTTVSNENRSFAISGVPAGEYDLQILGNNAAALTSAFALRHVAIKGTDVTDINMTLIPLGSIAGQIQFEPQKAVNQECKTSIKRVLTAIPLKAVRDEQDRSEALQHPAFQIEGHELSNESGEFVLSNLVSGLYRVESQLTGSDLYVKSITLESGAIDVARHGLKIKPGEQLKGVSIILTDGAAGLRGRVITKGNSPTSIRLHLLPAEQAYADEILRYAEAPVLADGTFQLKNLTPGRYWVIARSVLDETDSPYVRPLAWDAKERAKLRSEAESANSQLELQPCQQMTEYVVSYTPMSQSTPPVKPTPRQSN